MKIGFEIHEQLETDRKLFCDCPTDYRDAPPNTNVCPVCTGMPGSKPAPPNRRAIESAMEVALMLDCEVVVDEPIYIQRKHYDYPDLPSGYQRTSLPIATDGELNGVGIREVHIEEDPGKYDPTHGTVDYNRSGIPLVEVITEPELHSAEESRDFLRSLRRALEYTEKVRPEPGTLRADTNISLEGGGRVEIKNINSVKGAYRALKYEIMRQKKAMESGEGVIRETRAYMESQMITVPMRTKEVAEDYRYIPDPDIFPIVIERSQVEEIRQSIFEAPHLRERRLVKEYGIDSSIARIMVSERKLADLFESVVQRVDPEFASHWFKDALKKVLNYMNMRAADIEFTPQQMVKLLKMIEDKDITPEQGELVLREMVKSPADPEKLVKKLGLEGLVEDELQRAIDEVIENNPKAIKDVRKGKEEALNFLAGQAMKLTEGRADPRKIIKLLRKRVAENK
ncbi:glutamyl-tRNA amidotransferase [candidate division MSBL1 archaeon SCGC-AAA261D19]|uniref:Aspartyl/glutamyl-tRNA(Asn/Gln) amidotransferase subunit B n=1 Tax=candidate division MSBL1 archaeon SCGC-AAA261D19 TaxID=1698273 RepID=A0A133V821_9EURY|nr:glutamyl-tRNA amidotransferase [candidate division MSBL1 archaeon SCGC-AAA261D19]